MYICLKSHVYFYVNKNPDFIFFSCFYYVISTLLDQNLFSPWIKILPILPIIFFSIQGSLPIGVKILVTPMMGGVTSDHQLIFLYHNIDLAKVSLFCFCFNQPRWCLENLNVYKESKSKLYRLIHSWEERESSCFKRCILRNISSNNRLLSKCRHTFKIGGIRYYLGCGCEYGWEMNLFTSLSLTTDPKVLLFSELF
jgi:hypothetical protein